MICGAAAKTLPVSQKIRSDFCTRDLRGEEDYFFFCKRKASEFSIVLCPAIRIALTICDLVANNIFSLSGDCRLTNEDSSVKHSSLFTRARYRCARFRVNVRIPFRETSAETKVKNFKSTRSRNAEIKKRLIEIAHLSARKER